MIDKRWFGVELEFNSNGLDIPGVARVLGQAFDRNNMRRWYFTDRMHYDGSDIELATPKLRGNEGFEKLHLVMDTLRENGCFCTEEDGMHVHHDAPEFVNNIGNCIRLVKSWKANQHLIYEFVDPSRTTDYYGGIGNHWACPAWSQEAIRELETSRRIPNWDRNDLNLIPLLRSQGTIEIRLHEGTLDFNHAESWIKFGQRFLKRVLKHQMRDSREGENMLKKVQIDPKAERILLDKKAMMQGVY